MRALPAVDADPCGLSIAYGLSIAPTPQPRARPERPRPAGPWPAGGERMPRGTFPEPEP